MAPVLGVLLVTVLLAYAPAALAKPDAKVAAREHFQKGVAAFEDRRFGEAAEEFDAAYRLWPAYVVLYNIGQVDVALGRSVEAVDAFDKYLKQGASSITAERRREVEAEIDKQTARIGTLAIRTFPEGAEVRVDGKLAGKTPLPGPARVDAGHHTIEAILADHAPRVREVDVAGRAEITVELTLEAVAAPAPPPPAPPPPEPPVVARSVERIVIETPPAPAPPADGYGGQRASDTRERRRDSGVNWQRIAGITLTVAGIGTATWGGILAYRGATKSSDAQDRLADPSLTDEAWDAAKRDFDDGKSANQRGWIIAGVGAAGVVGGIILTATAPERSSSLAFASWLTAREGGLIVRGAF